MPGPKLFFADERGLGGRQLLQQQFRNMKSRIVNARGGLETTKTGDEVYVDTMLLKGLQRRDQLRRTPYCDKIKIKKINTERRGRLDCRPPETFTKIWWLPINKSLRECEYRKNHKRRPPNPGSRLSPQAMLKSRMTELARSYFEITKRRAVRKSMGVAITDSSNGNCGSSTLSDPGASAHNRFRMSPHLRSLAVRVLTASVTLDSVTPLPPRPYTAPPGTGTASCEAPFGVPHPPRAATPGRAPSRYYSHNERFTPPIVAARPRQCLTPQPPNMITELDTLQEDLEVQHTMMATPSTDIYE